MRSLILHRAHEQFRHRDSLSLLSLPGPRITSDTKPISRTGVVRASRATSSPRLITLLTLSKAYNLFFALFPETVGEEGREGEIAAFPGCGVSVRGGTALKRTGTSDLRVRRASLTLTWSALSSFYFNRIISVVFQIGIWVPSPLCINNDLPPRSFLFPFLPH